MDPTIWLTGSLALLLMMIGLASYFHERRRLSNGIWLNGFVLCAGGWLLIVAVSSGQMWLLIPNITAGPNFTSRFCIRNLRGDYLPLA